MSNEQSGIGELILIDYERNPEFSREGNPRTFEFVWSFPMGNNAYRLFHTPLWTKGIHLNDVVTVDDDKVVTGVKESAEYRTAVVTYSEEQWDKISDFPIPLDTELEKVHCELDWLSGSTYVVSVHRKVSNEELEAIVKENGNPKLEWVE